MDSDSFNVLSLCSGAGGLDLGVGLAVPSARTVCYVEHEAYACEVLATRMEEQAMDEAPVWTDLRAFDGRPWRGAVDLIVGGYPCQPFSRTGRMLGADDPRHLWPEVARIIREVNPGYLFLENVANHINLGFREVAGELLEMDYRIAAGLFTAAEVGAPHIRERLFVLAHANSILHRHGYAGASENVRFCPQNDERNRLPVSDERAWDTESPVERVAYGVAAGVDRLRLCGNGVVPLAAAYAFRLLHADLFPAD